MAWTIKKTTYSGSSVSYWLFVPDNPPAGNLPVIVHLHGIGEKGDGTDAAMNNLFTATPAELKAGVQSYNFICIIPQLNEAINNGWGQGWRPEYTDVFVNEISKYQGDLNRIYISGLSYGGGGSLWYSCSSSIYASKVAACVDICGVCLATADYSQPAKNNIPVVGFHANDDPTVSPGCTIGQLTNINSFNPKTKALVNIFTTGGHSIWGKVYDQTNSPFTNGFTKNIYEWMLQYSKGATTPTTPPVPITIRSVSVTYSDGSVKTIS